MVTSKSSNTQQKHIYNLGCCELGKSLSGEAMALLAGVWVKFLKVGETDSIAGYHLMAEGHSIHLGV